MTEVVQPPARVRLDPFRKVVLAVGLMALSGGVSASVLKLARHLYRVGPWTLAAFALGAFLIWGALYAKDARWSRALFLALLNCAGCYALLLALDLFIYTRRPVDRMRGIQSTRNLFVLDDAVGFKLTPNFRGYYEDGQARLEIRTNSRGHRDDDPRPARPGTRSIILGGDSFTFGVLLAQSETISSQLDTLSHGSVDAYNVGVPSYGPRNVFETFARSADLPASDLLYLFYNNDFEDILRPWDEYTLYDGYLVRKRNEDGTPYTLEELRAKLRTSREDQHKTILQRTISDMIALRELRSRIGFDRLLHRSGTDRESNKLAGVPPTLDYTLKMRELADSRHLGFWVVILPTIWEAEKGAYGEDTRTYVELLRTHNIRTIEPLPHLRYHDYIPYDGHFEPTGATITAREILSALSKAR